MKIRKRFQFSIQHLWALTVMVGVFIFVNTHPIRPQDFWWHMAVGRDILATGHIPSVDTYSYTMAGQPYPSYQMFWLTEAALYLVYQLGGGELIVFVHSLLITGAYGLILILSWYASKSWRIAALATLFAAALGINDWNVRPQAVTFLLGGAILFAVYRFRVTRSKRYLAIFPVVMLIWSNSHGTFPIGMGLIAAWWLDEAWATLRRKQKIMDGLLFPTIGGLLAGVACLVNPQGIRIINYVTGLSTNPVIQNMVPEWAAPNSGTWGGALFLGSVIAAACILALSPQRPGMIQILLFISFSWLGLNTLRGSIWYGLVMAPILAEHIHAMVNTYLVGKVKQVEYTGSPRVNRIFLAVLLLMVIVSLPWFKNYLHLPTQKAGIYSYETPLEATDYLIGEKLPGPLFHGMSFGSYLIWEAQPDYPVFVDSRIELYDARIWKEYIETSNAVGDWQGLLDRYGVQTIMASPIEQAGLMSALSTSTIWKMVYSDAAAVIFTRNH